MTKLKLPADNAIRYSGCREGQNPDKQTYPTFADIREDFNALRKQWQLLRLCDCNPECNT
jgi:hypothetical protein